MYLLVDAGTLEFEADMTAGASIASDITLILFPLHYLVTISSAFNSSNIVNSNEGVQSPRGGHPDHKYQIYLQCQCACRVP